MYCVVESKNKHDKRAAYVLTHFNCCSYSATYTIFSMLIDPIFKYIKINKKAVDYPSLTNVEVKCEWLDTALPLIGRPHWTQTFTVFNV